VAFTHGGVLEVGDDGDGLLELHQVFGQYCEEFAPLHAVYLLGELVLEGGVHIAQVLSSQLVVMLLVEVAHDLVPLDLDAPDLFEGFDVVLDLGEVFVDVVECLLLDVEHLDSEVYVVLLLLTVLLGLLLEVHQLLVRQFLGEVLVVGLVGVPGVPELSDLILLSAQLLGELVVALALLVLDLGVVHLDLLLQHVLRVLDAQPALLDRFWQLDLCVLLAEELLSVLDLVEVLIELDLVLLLLDELLVQDLFIAQLL